MCGIAGFVCAPGRTFDERHIQDALEVLKSRGPDGTSWLGIAGDGMQLWKKEQDCELSRPLNLAIGCSRLAINDVSEAGLQPIASSDQTNWVVFNGEVFNFIELREELKTLGLSFKTGTDTEVIANAYAAWGVSCFERFNGQYGIAILDQAHGKLILARDRVGIVPLFYRSTPDALAFGSEIKAILKLPLPKPELNLKQIAVRIGLPYKLHYQPGASLYEDVKQVLPGQYLVFDLRGHLQEARDYWRAEDIRDQWVGSFGDAREQLRELLIDSVKIRLRTDRKFAFIVSGGVDSPAVLGIAKKLFSIDTETFSLDLPDERFNENESIREVMAGVGLIENFIPVTSASVADLVDEVVSYSDEPLATPNALLHGILARAIDATGTRVVLNGVGGDEVFLGYHDHFLYHLRQLKQDNDSRFSSERLAWQNRQNRPSELLDAFCSFIDSGDARHSPDFLARSKGADYRGLLDDGFRKQHFPRDELFTASDHTPRGKQILDLTALTIPYSIRMDDNCYLAKAVEVRQPFLDHRLIEFGLSMPAAYKIRCGISKFILRQAVRGLIPDTRRRDVRKIGLNLPIDTWMRKSLRGWVEGELGERGNPLYQFADYNAVRNLLEQHYIGAANHSLKIWDLCSMNNWLARAA